MPDGVTVTMVLTLKPEAVDAFCRSAPDMLKATRAYAGFRDIRMLRNKDNPNQIIMIEDWDSPEAYQAYVAWRTETGAMDGLAAVIAAPPELNYWNDRVA